MGNICQGQGLTLSVSLTTECCLKFEKMKPAPTYTVFFFLPEEAQRPWVQVSCHQMFLGHFHHPSGQAG